MMNAYMKMSNEELMLAVGGRHGKKGLCEGPIRTVHGLQSGWLAPSPAMTTATRLASFTMEMKSRSSATML